MKMQVEEKSQQKRQTAFRIWIKDILQSKYYVDEGWNPNYISLPNGEKISRVNLIATVISVSKEDEHQNVIFVDDGSAEIAVRSFNEIDMFNGLSIGDIAQIVGKIREFNGEKYIVPEIIKKINNHQWLYLRKLELEKSAKEKNNDSGSVLNQEKELAEQEVNKKKSLEVDALLAIIKDLDTGDGADFDAVIKKSAIPDCEEQLNKLLMDGEVFELKPGKIKVLE